MMRFGFYVRMEAFHPEYRAFMIIISAIINCILCRQAVHTSAEAFRPGISHKNASLAG